ncbi:hypothetical protein quinque_010782 [Culex quinquefasciatus]
MDLGTNHISLARTHFPRVVLKLLGSRHDGKKSLLSRSACSTIKRKIAICGEFGEVSDYDSGVKVIGGKTLRNPQMVAVKTKTTESTGFAEALARTKVSAS